MDHYFTNNSDLKSEIKTIEYSYNKYDFVFFSDNGVFSKDRIDYGSRVLLDSFLKSDSKPKKLLDIGCGYGFLGIVISKVKNTFVVMSDVNKRALHLAKMNIEKNKANAITLESNIYDNVDEKYDVIITNPPIRAGKNVVLDILTKAKEYLNDDGELWYVIRKDQGAKSIEKVMNEHYKVEIIEKSKGFYIFRCKIY